MVDGQRWARTLWVAFLAYSLLRFAFGGIFSPTRSIIGDFYSAFPGPFVQSYNPLLLQEAIFGAGHVSVQGWWNYGPGFHLITFPLTFLTSYRVIDLLTHLGLWTSAVAAFWLWGRRVLRLSSGWEWFLVAVVWLNFTPLHAAFGQRAIEVLELFLIVWAFAYWGRQISGGAAIGLAVSLKFLPAIFFPYLAWKRRWAALGAAVAVSAVLFFALQPALPWSRSSTLREYRVTTFGQRHATTHINNQALVNLLQRPFVVRQLEGGFLEIRDSARVRRWAGWLNLAVLAALAVYVIRYFPSTRPGLISLEGGLLLTIMAMLVNRNQTYYLAFALPGLSAAAIHLVREAAGRSRQADKRRTRLAWAVVLAVSYLMMSPIIPMRLIDWWLSASPLVALDTWKLWGGPGLGGMLLLVALVGLHARAVREEASGVP